jgi:predicted PurR-regulated permease PerM
MALGKMPPIPTRSTSELTPAVEIQPEFDQTPAEAVAEEVEVLHASVKAGSIAQIVVAVIAVLGLIYLLKLVLVTIFASILLAFILEPLVKGGQRLHIPRPVGAVIGILLLLALCGALSYFFYSRAVDFASELPHYSHKIRSSIGTVVEQTRKIEESTKSVMAQPQDRKAVPVEVQQSDGLSHILAEGGGAVADTLLAIGFVPFLVFFMITWKDHVHNTTVRLFPKEHRIVAHRTLGRISVMMRSFIVGNLLVGLVNSGVSIAVFWALGIPYFYFIGVISGFVSLIPYLGIFLALLPPVAGGMGVLDKTGFALVLLTVVGLHIFTMNVLYPKVVGKRLKLNPLAVTLALLFWAWIWGAMGLILAVPLLGATKIVCDYIDSLRGLGAWLGE